MGLLRLLPLLPLLSVLAVRADDDKQHDQRTGDARTGDDAVEGVCLVERLRVVRACLELLCHARVFDVVRGGAGDGREGRDDGNVGHFLEEALARLLLHELSPLPADDNLLLLLQQALDSLLELPTDLPLGLIAECLLLLRVDRLLLLDDEDTRPLLAAACSL